MGLGHLCETLGDLKESFPSGTADFVQDGILVCPLPSCLLWNLKLNLTSPRQALCPSLSPWHVWLYRSSAFCICSLHSKRIIILQCSLECCFLISEPGSLAHLISLVDSIRQEKQDSVQTFERRWGQQGETGDSDLQQHSVKGEVVTMLHWPSCSQCKSNES